MNKNIGFAIAGLFLLTSCAMRSSQAQDATVDTNLGVHQKEQSHEAVKTLEEIQESQRQEQKRQLERQITEPAEQPTT